MIHGQPRRALQAALRNRGVQVVAVHTVENARACLNSTAFQLVVFDCEGNAEAVHKLCGEIAASRKAIQITFLVGRPEYLAAAPDTHGSTECPEAILAKLDPLRALRNASVGGAPAKQPRFIEAIWRMHLRRASLRPAAVPLPERTIEVAVKSMLPKAIEFGDAVLQAERIQDQLATERAEPDEQPGQVASS